MRVRAIVFAGITAQAPATMSCSTSEARSPDVLARRPTPVEAPQKSAAEPTLPPLPCSPRGEDDPTLAAEAERLADAMFAYQPLVKNRPRGEKNIRAIARRNVEVVEASRCQVEPLLSWEKDPYLLAAIQFHESSWRADVVGGRGEVGLMQVHGVALQGRRREEAFDPGVNVRLGYEYLHRCRRVCEGATPEMWLGAFASGRCTTRIPAARHFLQMTEAIYRRRADHGADARASTAPPGAS